MRETTYNLEADVSNSEGNFNPRPPCGRRLCAWAETLPYSKFQPTSPVRETTAEDAGVPAVKAISTHVPRAGDDISKGNLMISREISTHVPRAGDDLLLRFHI